MRRSFNKTGRQKLEIMFKMREMGHSYNKIAEMMNVHHTTVLYWFGKLSKHRPTKSSKNFGLLGKLRGKPVEDKKIFKDNTGIVINKGKSYREYLKEQKLNKNYE